MDGDVRCEGWSGWHGCTCRAENREGRLGGWLVDDQGGSLASDWCDCRLVGDWSGRWLVDDWSHLSAWLHGLGLDLMLRLRILSLLSGQLLGAEGLALLLRLRSDLLKILVLSRLLGLLVHLLLLAGQARVVLALGSRECRLSVRKLCCPFRLRLLLIHSGLGVLSGSQSWSLRSSGGLLRLGLAGEREVREGVVGRLNASRGLGSLGGGCLLRHLGPARLGSIGDLFAVDVTLTTAASASLLDGGEDLRLRVGKLSLGTARY